MYTSHSTLICVIMLHNYIYTMSAALKYVCILLHMTLLDGSMMYKQTPAVMNTTMPWTTPDVYIQCIYIAMYLCILLRIASLIKRACINNSYSLTYVVRSEDVCHGDSECAAHLTGYSEPTS